MRPRQEAQEGMEGEEAYEEGFAEEALPEEEEAPMWKASNDGGCHSWFVQK